MLWAKPFMLNSRRESGV